MKDWCQNFNSLSSSHSDAFGKCFKPGMVCDVIVIYVFALCDLIVERFFKTEKGNAGNCERNSRFASHNIIFMPDSVNNIVEVAGRGVRSFGNYFKHP